MDFLERHLLNPNYETVWIGYTSTLQGRVATPNCGIWLGYKNGELFTEFRFRYTTPVKKEVWSHAVSLTTLFDEMHRHMTSPPLILLSSRQAIKVIQNTDYKWLKLSQQEKAKLFFWMDTLTPALEFYDILEQPFCLLRELMWEESKNVRQKINKKEFESWTDLAEPDNMISG